MSTRILVFMHIVQRTVYEYMYSCVLYMYSYKLVFSYSYCIEYSSTVVQ